MSDYKLLWLIKHSPQFFQFLLLILFKHSLHHNLQDSIEKLSNGAWLANLSSQYGYATYLARSGSKPDQAELAESY
jgi:hypothetical protein